MEYNKVFLGLGSNTGNRAENVKKALEALKNDPRLRLMKVSRFYVTSPVGPRQRDFVNAAALVKTVLKPAELLKAVKELEIKLGRKPSTQRWGPRKIDIDILFFGNRVLKEKGLNIPHPEIAGRLFVLAPLCDIAPGLRHPGLKTTIRQMKEALLLTHGGQKVKILNTDNLVKVKNNG